MTQADIARFFQLRRRCSEREAVRLAEAVVIRPTDKPRSGELFPTIGGSHWRESLARGRREKNSVREQIWARIQR